MTHHINCPCKKMSSYLLSSQRWKHTLLRPFISEKLLSLQVKPIISQKAQFGFHSDYLFISFFLSSFFSKAIHVLLVPFFTILHYFVEDVQWQCQKKPLWLWQRMALWLDLRPFKLVLIWCTWMHMNAIEHSKIAVCCFLVP